MAQVLDPSTGGPEALSGVQGDLVACGKLCELGMRVMQHPAARRADYWVYRQAERGAQAIGTGLQRAGAALSSTLARALEAAGFSRPVGAAAHHIVAGKSPAAAQARAVLQRFGIGINNAVNGVFLPATRAAPNAAGAAVHSTLHTNSYYQTVNQMLGAATTPAEAEAALQAIRQALLSGGL